MGLPGETAPAKLFGKRKARLDRRGWGLGRIEPPAAACRWADSLGTEHHARLNEILRAVGCCDGREEGNVARNNVPPLPAAVDIEETAQRFVVAT